MNINLSLLSKPKDISMECEIPENYYENTAVKGLNNIHAQGLVKINVLDELEINLEVTGIMILEDSVTLEPIEYPFNLKIEEIYDVDAMENADFIKKNQNTLDIIELLWENIVLEVPISITKEQDKRIKGNGWELNGEMQEEQSELAKLKDLFKGGE